MVIAGLGHYSSNTQSRRIFVTLFLLLWMLYIASIIACPLDLQYLGGVTTQRRLWWGWRGLLLHWLSKQSSMCWVRCQNIRHRSISLWRWDPPFSEGCLVTSLFLDHQEGGDVWYSVTRGGSSSPITPNFPGGEGPVALSLAVPVCREGTHVALTRVGKRSSRHKRIHTSFHGKPELLMKSGRWMTSLLAT
jgi:hypothetical protein